MNYRDYHATTRPEAWRPVITPVKNGLQIDAFDGAQPFFLYSQTAALQPKSEWYSGLHLEAEDYRGQDDTEDALYYASHIQATLDPGQSLTVVVTSEDVSGPDGGPERRRGTSLFDSQEAEQEFWTWQTGRGASCGNEEQATAVKQLVLAADQFIVKRATPDDEDGRTVIAGYPWFSDWGRDTMIALPGLTLTTGRTDDAARYCARLPSMSTRACCPTVSPMPAKSQSTTRSMPRCGILRPSGLPCGHRDDDLLAAPVSRTCRTSLPGTSRGTRYHIHLDPADGLIYAGEAGVQLTWMDAKVGDWVVTPRIGKPVEINALWYNALRVMADLPAAGPTGRRL